MSQLLAPSEALSGSFVLPQIDGIAEQADSTDGSTEFISYALMMDNLGLLLPENTVSTLVEGELPFCQLPNTSPALKGMANINGNIVPIFDLAMLLEIETQEHANVKTLIISQGEDAVGVIVPSAPFRVHLSTTDRMNGKPPLPAALQPFAQACYKTDRLWVSWDAEGFFTTAGERI